MTYISYTNIFSKYTNIFSKYIYKIYLNLGLY